MNFSYADEYVNVILAQALNAKSELRILNVSPASKYTEDEIKTDIAEKLHINSRAQIIPIKASAKEFLTNLMNKEYLANYLAEPDDVPFQ